MPSIILAAHGGITSRHNQDVGRPWLHRGIDQGHNNKSAYDLEICAPAAGEVTFAGLFGSYGLVIFIEHDDGWTSVLAHHSKHLVEKGDRVERGEIIAVMGNSGTKYIHSHQELRNAKGAQVDPLKHLFTAAPAASKPAAATPVKVVPPTVLPTRKKTIMPIGFMTTNHGKNQWGVGVEKGVWFGLSTQAAANTVSEKIGTFAVVSVAEFTAIRDSYLS